MPPRGPASIHQLKITLTRIRPPVWRRIQVASTINLRRLHDVIQATMGWTQSHLYEFALFQDQRFGLELSLPRPDLVDCRTVVYTPSMTTTPKRLEDALHELRWSLHYAVEAAQHAGQAEPRLEAFDDRWTELVIVDEADRLKFPPLEQLRDIYDRGRFGLVLIGMPGLEKRLARYAQFYSRVGFVHHYRPLSADAMRLVLAHKWQQLGLTLAPDDFNDAEAMAAIIRITGGNLRLVQRLFSQIERILPINRLQAVTTEVVEAARQSLVIGSG